MSKGYDEALEHLEKTETPPLTVSKIAGALGCDKRLIYRWTEKALQRLHKAVYGGRDTICLVAFKNPLTGLVDIVSDKPGLRSSEDTLIDALDALAGQCERNGIDLIDAQTC